MVSIYDARTNQKVGTLTDDQFAEISAQLEEEWPDDHDYYINQPTIEMFETAGVSAPVVAVLRQALGDANDTDIRWARDGEE